MTIFSRLKTFGSGIWAKALSHKILSAVILVVVIWGGHRLYTKYFTPVAAPQYVLATVQKGSLVSSVSGSGQVSVSNQIDLKPKVSGDVVFVNVKEGQQVKTGTLLVQLDARDASKAVRDAQTSLESAQLALEKITQPSDALTKLQAQDALAQAQQAKQNAQDGLVKAYDDGFNAVANTFIDLPGVMTGLESILNGTTVNGSQSNVDAYFDMANKYRDNTYTYRDSALAAYKTARDAYTKNFQDYKEASRYSDRATIDALIKETYDTTKSVSEAIKNIKNFFDFVSDTLTTQGVRLPPLLPTHQASLQTYTGTTNNHLGDLLSISTTIKSDNDAIGNSDRTISEKTEALNKINTGADPLDIRSQQIAVKQRANALQDARETLANYYIRAPFDGVVAKLDVKKGDPASGGAAVATFITTQRIATLSLNEVDIAKIKMGQKATITFDAFPDLTISGEVIQIDTIGTTTQGVVTYNVSIAFDTQDERVKPGMSMSAAIITDVKQDVLLVPSGAVKSQGGTQYVQSLENGQPVSHQVEVGASNDTMTEIVSGLSEGDSIIARTIAASATTQTQQTTTGGLRIPGLGGGGGNAGFRAAGGAGR